MQFLLKGTRNKLSSGYYFKWLLDFIKRVKNNVFVPCILLWLFYQFCKKKYQLIVDGFFRVQFTTKQAILE